MINFLRLRGVASITWIDFSDFSGKFLIKFIIDSAKLRSESRINFRKTCGKFVGDFSTNFCAKFFVDILSISAVILPSRALFFSISAVRLTLISDIRAESSFYYHVKGGHWKFVSDDINQKKCAKKNRRCKVFKDRPQGVVLQDECRHNFEVK